MENQKKILEVQLHELNSLLKQSSKNVTKYKDLDNGHGECFTQESRF